MNGMVQLKTIINVLEKYRAAPVATLGGMMRKTGTAMRARRAI